MFLLVRNCPRRFQRLFRRHLYYTKLIHGSEDGTQQHIFLMKAYKNTLPASKNNNRVLNCFASAAFHSKLCRQLSLLLISSPQTRSVLVVLFRLAFLSDIKLLLAFIHRYPRLGETAYRSHSILQETSGNSELERSIDIEGVKIILFL